MKIGELAERTGVSTRLLRYYEEQGLLSPERAQNGYRDYSAQLVDRVQQIRGLIEAGIPTRIINEILPCLANPCTIMVTEATPEILQTLENQRDQMTSRIDCLARNRDAIDAYLDAVKALNA